MALVIEIPKLASGLSSAVFASIANQLTLLKSSDGGLSFDSTVNTGLVSSSSTVSVQSANGKLFHVAGSDNARVSSNGSAFNACAGITSSTPGTIIKVAGTSEYLSGGVGLFASNDGDSFAARDAAGFGVFGITQLADEELVLGMVGGRFLNRSQNFGAAGSWGIYSLGATVSANQGGQFLLWTGERLLFFGNGPSEADPRLIIGRSLSGLTGSWTLAAGPENGPLSSICHGVAQDPVTGRILMVLRNGHSWYCDDRAGITWLPGPDVPYGAPLNYPFSLKQLVKAPAGFLFSSTMGGGVNRIYMTSDGEEPWDLVYESTDGNRINELAVYP